MANILVVYATDYGNTKTVAEAVADGARSVAGTEVTVKEAEAVTGDDLTAADGIVFGSPTHMGSADWRIKKLIDTVCAPLWMKDALVGKVGAVFATGGGYGNAGGGNEVNMLGMLNNFAELGLVLLPLPRNTPGYGEAGLQWGPYVRTHAADGSPAGTTAEQLVSAHQHGANVARAADALRGNSIFAA